eukprot:7215486-Karenia_brevis.AAC.1
MEVGFQTSDCRLFRRSPWTDFELRTSVFALEAGGAQPCQDFGLRTFDFGLRTCFRTSDFGLRSFLEIPPGRTSDFGFGFWTSDFSE